VTLLNTAKRFILMAWTWKSNSTIREDLLLRNIVSNAWTIIKLSHRSSRLSSLTSARTPLPIQRTYSANQRPSYGSIPQPSWTEAGIVSMATQIPLTSSPPPKSVPSRLATSKIHAMRMRRIKIQSLEQVHMLRLTQNQPGSKLSSNQKSLDSPMKRSV